ncbi:MAG: DMT family transporter, partial [Chloroflexi bacterium]|nr:DMT family transporter [Chloroflexota bacterium]
LILREKINWKKIFYILLAFVGVVIISVKDISSIFTWGNGEILAFLSATLCSLSIVTRKWQSKILNNIEMTQILLFIAFLMVFFSSFIFGGAIPHNLNFAPGIIIAIVLGGLFNVVIINLTNFGFEKIQTSLASNILTLEMLFAVLFGLFIYREVPSAKEWLGGIFILLSVIQMNKLE